MDFSEKYGKNVEEAVALALQDLKLTRDEVTVTVLEEPSSGFLGLIGNKLALVRVEKKKTEAPAPVVPEKVEKAHKTEITEKLEKVEKQENTDKPNIEKKEKKEKRHKSDKPAKSERVKKEKPERDDVDFNDLKVTAKRPDDLVEDPDHPAIVFLKDMTEKMGLTLNITAMKNDACLYVDIDGKDSGTVIGKRGQTLDAIQYLTSLVVNKDKDKYVRVVVDAENYRAKREKTLEQLANRLADKVMKTKKSVRLEPMNPYERKVIHATLQSNPAITTRSEGEEPYRRVIIELK